MRRALQSIGLAALAAVLQLAAGGAANAQIINYTGQTAQDVFVTFVDLPANTQIVIVERISGTIASAPGFTVNGSGSLNVPLVGLIPGDYYVLARLASSVWIAQTVVFYV